RHCEEKSDKAISIGLRPIRRDCFAVFILGPAGGRTRGLAMTVTADRDAMRAALALARRGLGTVWPNPAVGCVIVKDGRVVGRGWTQPGGRPHAESEALDRAGAAAGGATAYVTLEPC